MTNKRFLVSLLVLLVACSSAFSVAGVDSKRSREPSVSETEQSTQTTQKTSIFAKKSQTVSNDSSRSQEEKFDKEAFKKELEATYKDYKAVVNKAVEAEERVHDLEKKNQKQAKIIEDGKLGTRPYVMIDALSGIEDGGMSYGVGGTVGVEFNNGIMLEGGAGYNFGKFGSTPKTNNNNLQFHVGAGYKF